MKRTLLAALIATGALASSQSFAATYFGDENDLSWLPARAQSQPSKKFDGAAVQSTIVHYGDENDLSWLPAAKK
jgi:hypothetical protein